MAMKRDGAKVVFCIVIGMAAGIGLGLLWREITPRRHVTTTVVPMAIRVPMHQDAVHIAMVCNPKLSTWDKDFGTAVVNVTAWPMACRRLRATAHGDGTQIAVRWEPRGCNEPAS